MSPLRGVKGQTKGQTGCCSCPGDGSCANVRGGGGAEITSGGIPVGAALTRVQGPAGIGPRRQGATAVGGRLTAWPRESPRSRQRPRQGLGCISAES